MKKIVTIIAVSTIILWWVVSAQTTASVAKNSVKAIEQRDDVANTDLYTNISNIAIMNTLQAACEDRPVAKGKAFVAAASQILDNKYAGINDAAILEDSKKLYDLVKRLNEWRMDSYYGDDYCKLKYALVWLQQYLRETHIAVMEKTGIINDFGGVDYSTIHWFDVKMDTMRNHNAAYRSYQNRIWTPIVVSYANASFKNSLDDNEKALLNETESLMKSILAYSFYSLKKEGIIDQSDINEVADKVTFEYVKECGLFNWRYEIKQTLDSRGNHIKYETTDLNLKVNLCPSYFVITELPTLFKKIIIHELGHHVYYYRDANSDAFEAICRDDITSRNTQCGWDDFVTQYAQTASVEDYAEHFMYRFLKLPISNSAIMKQKTAHFANF